LGKKQKEKGLPTRVGSSGKGGKKEVRDARGIGVAKKAPRGEGRGGHRSPRSCREHGDLPGKTVSPERGMQRTSSGAQAAYRTREKIKQLSLGFLWRKGGDGGRGREKGANEIRAGKRGG